MPSSSGIGSKSMRPRNRLVSSTIPRTSNPRCGYEVTLRRLSDLALDQTFQLVQRCTTPGADIEDRRSVIAIQESGQRSRYVSCIDVVADRGSIAVEFDRLAPLDPAQEGHDRALSSFWPLVLAVHGGAAQDASGEAVVSTVSSDFPLAGEVQFAVEGQRPRRLTLAHRQPLGLSIYRPPGREVGECYPRPRP